ncbi:MAG: ATP-dependent helicase RecQ [Gammaproteobacteria bacterium]|nr:ATP-dependent helicase RecQ [Gammaproteobacteria bacterium]
MKRAGRPSGRRVAWDQVRAEAARRFGITHFRPGQRELIESVLAGDDALGILPTGAGKSLCYQLPALFLEGAVVVVAPLIALMKDQHEHLTEADIDAARLDSTVTETEQRQQEQAMRRGAHEVVLLTPERLLNPAHLEPLKRRGVGLFVVDEAHCVSQWGHDFRPAYLELRHAIGQLGHPPVLALTATAPPDRVDDILGSLGIPDARVIQGGIERENLDLQVLRTVNREEKEQRLLEILNETQGAGIVYVATVRRANELHEWLVGQGVDALRYHGQLKLSERERAQERFMDGRCRVIVATNAFGLGVDKPDVRCVVHWNFPESLESYYQEAGRAGRDGLPARCVLLYRLEDKRVRSFFLGGKHPRGDEVRRCMQALCRASRQAGGATLADLAAASGLSERRAAVINSGLEAMNVVVRQGKRRRLRHTMDDTGLERFIAGFTARHDADRERLRAMMRYGETTLCRMKYIREYFGEAPGERCGHCDNCRQAVRDRGQAPTLPGARKTTRRSRPPVEHLSFQRGQKVRHARFGTGEVLDVAGEELEVAFIRHGQRRVLASYLQPLEARG